LIVRARVNEDPLVIGLHVADDTFGMRRCDDLVVLIVEEDDGNRETDALVKTNAEGIVMISNRL
jgi:hypothetical protein